VISEGTNLTGTEVKIINLLEVVAEVLVIIIQKSLIGTEEAEVTEATTINLPEVVEEGAIMNSILKGLTGTTTEEMTLQEVVVVAEEPSVFLMNRTRTMPSLLQKKFPYHLPVVSKKMEKQLIKSLLILSHTTKGQLSRTIIKSQLTLNVNTTTMVVNRSLTRRGSTTKMEGILTRWASTSFLTNLFMIPMASTLVQMVSIKREGTTMTTTCTTHLVTNLATLNEVKAILKAVKITSPESTRRTPPNKSKPSTELIITLTISIPSVLIIETLDLLTKVIKPPGKRMMPSLLP
jgi:hypothetical protein